MRFVPFCRRSGSRGRHGATRGESNKGLAASPRGPSWRGPSNGTGHAGHQTPNSDGMNSTVGGEIAARNTRPECPVMATRRHPVARNRLPLLIRCGHDGSPSRSIQVDQRCRCVSRAPEYAGSAQKGRWTRFRSPSQANREGQRDTLRSIRTRVAFDNRLCYRFAQ